MRYRHLYFSLLFVLISFQLFSIDYTFSELVKWKSIQQIDVSDNEKMSRPYFEGALYEGLDILPVFRKNYRIHSADVGIEIELQNKLFVPVTAEERQSLNTIGELPSEFYSKAKVIQMQKEPWLSIDIIPIRWNDSLNIFEKLISFDIVAHLEDLPANLAQNMNYANSSVLSIGSWYKIRVSESGIHTVTYNDLSAMGFDMNTATSNIALFGNGGGVLPEKNDDPYYDDLVENPIQMVDGGDGSFDPGDYFIFYAQGPIVWSWNALNQAFSHQNNYYDDYAYYFITGLNRAGKRIEDSETPSGTPTVEVNSFIDYDFHEEDTRNIAAVGRVWFGELYDLSSLTYDYIFNFPNVLKSSNSGYFSGAFAANSTTSSSFKISVNGMDMATVSIVGTTSNYDYGKEGATSFRFLPKDDNILISTSYQRNNTSAVGYLNYIEVNVQRSLTMFGNQMLFRNVFSNPDQVAMYTLGNTSDNLTIWDVTTPVDPKRIVTNGNGSQLQFNYLTQSVNEFVAFNSSGYKSVEFLEMVPNQNLHALRNIDYLIIAHPDFLEEANELADFHRNHSSFSTEVVSINQVYNEFASGSHDITAIRNFAKMLYDASDPGGELKYLLLFGDASYDYKDRIQDNSNYVPCWESLYYPLNIVNSIATDDYFGYLDDGEGVEPLPNTSSTDRVDIGIGRFVVRTKEEAQDAVDKVMHYAVNTTSVMSSYRNLITFIADDGDSNTHLKDAEAVSDFVGTAFPEYNINKIYVDAYEQESTPGGQKAPEVNRAINLQMDKGTLIFNYSGHGGEIGLGHEQIVTIADINSWTNYDKLTIFITATCEFTRYDDPSRISAGEQVFLNNKGGGIALFTTTRATFAAANRALNMDIYEDNMFEKINGEYPTLGDIIRQSKRRGSANDRKFILVGDPACRMAYPEYNAETTAINMNPIGEVPDTLKALAMINVSGRITDKSGVALPGYKGEIFPIVYDKLSEIVTYGDESSSPTTFYLRKNVLFNGKASVDQGEFNFEFMMPKDIAYKYGPGRISYYFRNDSTDGNGYFEDFIVGGFNPDALEDTIGPDISLFLFDSTFIPGSVVNQNPILFAQVKDESGINTTGSGIGHDIVTMLDDDPNKAYVLNDFYEADENSFNSGEITYPFADMEEGEHVLSLKVWDVYNNSSIAYLPFVVVSSLQVIVDNLRNFPNPFSETTQFTFTHNQAGNEIDVALHIYAIDGSLARTLNTKIDAEGFQTEPLVWDATTDDGSKIRRGFYIVRVVVKNEAGQVGEDSSKLIYIK